MESFENKFCQTHFKREEKHFEGFVLTAMIRANSCRKFCQKTVRKDAAMKVSTTRFTRVYKDWKGSR